nr:PREDICTED: golgin subfamily A member 6-like protein 22 [Latimeria chalumnae]|eukprot:XP_014352318.1 PREDICTED: golgin subfamily A member 6-like protein 22 [Latimeria chalumnae]
MSMREPKTLSRPRIHKLQQKHEQSEQQQNAAVQQGIQPQGQEVFTCERKRRNHEEEPEKKRHKPDSSDKQKNENGKEREKSGSSRSKDKPLQENRVASSKKPDSSESSRKKKEACSEDSEGLAKKHKREKGEGREKVNSALPREESSEGKAVVCFKEEPADAAPNGTWVSEEAKPQKEQKNTDDIKKERPESRRAEEEKTKTAGEFRRAKDNESQIQLQKTIDSGDDQADGEKPTNRSKEKLQEEKLGHCNEEGAEESAVLNGDAEGNKTTVSKEKSKGATSADEGKEEGGRENVEEETKGEKSEKDVAAESGVSNKKEGGKGEERMKSEERSVEEGIKEEGPEKDPAAERRGEPTCDGKDVRGERGGQNAKEEENREKPEKEAVAKKGKAKCDEEERKGGGRVEREKHRAKEKKGEKQEKEDRRKEGLKEKEKKAKNRGER